jgi:hypothetical protein
VTLCAAFADQSATCRRLGSPFMGRLCALLAEHWPSDSRLDLRCAEFSGDIGPAGASLPLRIAGGLHALVLKNLAPEMVAAYPPHDVSDAQLRDAVLSALETHERFMLQWIESPPQTNDVRRSAALMAGAAMAQEYFDLPVCLSDLGASGGLNLMWDHFALQLPDARLGTSSPVLTLAPDWEGPSPPLTLPQVHDRAGVDLNPLDLSHPEGLLRLTAFLWPDQPERMALTRAAAAVADAPLARGDAIDWLEERLKSAPEGHLHLVQHTVAWQYFSAEAQTRGTRLMETAGANTTASRPLAWLSMESDGDTRGALGAAVTLRMWPGDIRLDLGRADFHGRWIRWAGAY